MPTAHDYYSKHSRKISTSQMSLPEQLQNATNENASQSMTLLPATTYGGTKKTVGESNGPVNTPDFYHRQHHDQFAQPTGSFRQGAFKPTYVTSSETREDGQAGGTDGQQLVFQNGATIKSRENVKAHLNSPGLRSRKSSVKNLVNQINASSSSEDLPPIPTESRSRASSRNASPALVSETQFWQPGISRQFLGPGPSETFTNDHRPLFGEVIPGALNAPLPGYGIQSLRKRSGSEGSPLPSPGYLQAQNTDFLPNSVHTAVTTEDSTYILSPAVYTIPSGQIHHRRANSESPLTPTRNTIGPAASEASYPASQNRNHGRSSRIPVSVRRGSTGLEPEQRPHPSVMYPDPAVTPRSTDQKQTVLSRRPRSPPQIQSPGQRGKKPAAPQRSTSPSLRANIILPPPKISPPLRSSRPRVPISSASTAASRAKMAEKFSHLQKLNEERRQAIRKAGKPPELSDIDLKARRLRITQALSRSLEGQDLRASTAPPRRRDLSSSRTASPTLSGDLHLVDSRDAQEDIPVVIVDDATADETTPRDDAHPEDISTQERALSRDALGAMQGDTRVLGTDEDSPTLGPPGAFFPNRPARLQTNLERLDQGNEPSSAITEGTLIDPEPQDDHRRDSANESILSQINRMRSQNSLFSDREDRESVQIFLRDTLYLDEDDSIRKTYEAVPQLDGPQSYEHGFEDTQRSSWLSSPEGSEDGQDTAAGNTSYRARHTPYNNGTFGPSTHGGDSRGHPESSVRSTMASDAYTIVNVVLQQHSTAGIVDQQFVQDVYQRVLEDSPYGDGNSLTADVIEQICLQEIQDRRATWYESGGHGNLPFEQHITLEEDTGTPTEQSNGITDDHQTTNDWLLPGRENAKLAPPASVRGHRYKSSLDSAEDWADTSPSVGDWIRYVAEDESRKLKLKPSTTPAASIGNNAQPQGESLDNTVQRLRGSSQIQQEDPDLYSPPLPRASQTPPPLSTEQNEDRSPYGSAVIEGPQIPRRVTSISQIGRSSPLGRQSPNLSAPALGKISIDDPISPDQRRLKQRRNVIKELVDTEFTYEKDLRVLCDIYKQTASAALGDDDIKVLFGNVEQVQIFSKDFLMLLKSLAKPTYAMERQDRKKDRDTDKAELSVRPHSSSSTLASSKINDNELPTPEKDRETRIGQAFEASLADMEVVYTEYIKNRHAANLRLEAVQKSHAAREWLKECKENSSDITNAWNLDALLVKPVQRITKYPLLLKELVDATPDDHPDHPFLKRAMNEVTEVNIRINDVKKHAELVDQVFNRKRKDSDVRAGFSKAFGRRAEKLKQHVGITELFEDAKYNEIKIHYDNNIVQLMVVGNDCSSYGRAITKWVNKMVEIAAAAEAWVDVGHSNHQEAESRLRQLAMVVRGISTIALPDHLEQLNNKILTPMQQAVDAMTKFKTDPKGLLQKREKRMIDYAQMKTKKDRGERIDKKTIERMEQSEALNFEAKQRMRKLVAATAKLVQGCQANIVQMQVTWHGMVKQKLSAAMGISLEHLEVDDIEKDWQLDFDFQEASALSLGVCNGSLLAEAVNMVSFQASSTTLNGDESPRQASFTSASKRSVSLASENSYPPIPDYDPRTSGMYGHQQYHEHVVPYVNPRARAQSTASARLIRSPELSQHGSATDAFNNLMRQEATSQATPRLSLDTHSPPLAVTPQEQPPPRPVSSSTFFSASGDTPPPTQPNHQSTGSNIFSSAMPMSDSPVLERYTESSQLAEPEVLFTAASVYEFNIDRSRREAGFPYLTYVTGEIFDIIGERGELWLAKNQDDPQRQVGWIWNMHFAKLAV